MQAMVHGMTRAATVAARAVGPIDDDQLQLRCEPLEGLDTRQVVEGPFIAGRDAGGVGEGEVGTLRTDVTGSLELPAAGRGEQKK